MRYKAVVFDLDGTLINSMADLGNAVNRVLAKEGYPTHEISAYRNFIGDGARMMIKRALPSEKRDERTLDRCLDYFLEDYSRNFNVETNLYEGISDLLDYLKSRSIRTAILTNKPHEITIKFKESLLSKWDFEIVVGNKNKLPKKPDPTGAIFVSKKLGASCEEIVYLGDSDIDMKTAVSAGMLPVGALWGFRNREVLLNSGAKYLIDRPIDLLNLVDF